MTIPFPILGQKSKDPNRRVVLVTGSRGWTDETSITAVLISRRPTLVVHGACPSGADAIADKVCRILGIPQKRCPADWSKGRDAGFKRNIQMIEEEKPDTVLAFWDGTSNGTRHCIKEARRRGHSVEVFRQNEPQQTFL